MILSHIACIDDNNAIGYNNNLLFKSKEDIEWFKLHTMGKVILMGKNTYLSIGKPLKNRINVVLSNDKSFNPHPDVFVRHSLSDVLYEFKDEREIVCIGGQTLYDQTIKLANRLYITRVRYKYKNADSWYPEIDMTEWKEYYFKESKEGLIPTTFHVYKRSSKL